MSPLGIRIEERRKAIGISQAELARRCGMSQGGLNGLINGRASDSTYLPAIARELGTTADYLKGETNDPRRGGLPHVAATVEPDMDALMVPVLDIRGSMGGGQLIDEPVVIGKIPFPRAWLQARIRGRLDQVAVAYGEGTSMVPTIGDGDVCLFDRGDTTLRGDLIWFFRHGENALIKRLRPKPRGGVTIVSDNSAVPPYDADEEDMQIFGRVFWVGRWT